MNKLVFFFSMMVACTLAAPAPKPGVVVGAPIVTATSSQVVARNYNAAFAVPAAPLVAAAPAPLVAAAPAPLVAAPAFAPYAAAPAFAPYAAAPAFAPYAAAPAFASYAAAPGILSPYSAYPYVL